MNNLPSAPWSEIVGAVVAQAIEASESRPEPSGINGIATKESRDRPPFRLQQVLAEIERRMILEALHWAEGNMAKAGRALSMTERVMGLRIAKYGIRLADCRKHDPPPQPGSVLIEEHVSI